MLPDCIDAEGRRHEAHAWHQDGPGVEECGRCGLHRRTRTVVEWREVDSDTWHVAADAAR